MSMISEQIADLELCKEHWGEPENVDLARQIIDDAIDTIKALSAKVQAQNLHDGTESAKMILSESTYRAIARSLREFENKGWDFTIDELAKLVAERKLTDIRGIGKDRAKECEQAIANYYPNGNPYYLVLSKKEN